MVSISIKPGDKADETESPNLNLVNKTELKGEYESFFFFLLGCRCSENIRTEGVTN